MKNRFFILYLMLICVIITACSQGNSSIPQQSVQDDLENEELKQEKFEEMFGVIDKSNKYESGNDDELTSDPSSDQSAIKVREYYEEKTKPFLDETVSELTLVWDSLWIKTFNGLSDGSMDSMEAIKRLEAAEIRYDTLYSSLLDLPIEGLDEETEKKINSIRLDLEDSVGFRNEAINKMKKMLIKGELSNSVISDIEYIVGESNDLAAQAVLGLDEINSILDSNDE